MTFVTVQAGTWKTHFAYNNVTQIAIAPDKVFAISDGSLFSVDKQTEQVRVYNRQSGLHGTGITCIHYDEKGQQLIIAYDFGKMDILSKNGVQYIGALYDKDMTQRKTIYNITISGRTAYLSTHYGVQTMDLRENKLVDSYWLRPNGLETPIMDVLLDGDSIYAFGEDSLYCAKLSDPLSDYTYWHREALGRVARDEEKGKHYQDATNHWYAGYAEGIIRFTLTERLTYKPKGPLQNNPYRMRAGGQGIGMVPGGYAIPRYSRSGAIMLWNNADWTNFDEAYINAQTGLEQSTDYCDILFDPADLQHFFVASFGYGLFEFRNNVFYKHHNPDNSALEPVIATPTYPYVWVDGLQWDHEGNLWMLNNSYNGVKVLQANGEWMSISNKACQNLDRSKDLLVSVKNPHIKLVSSIRNGIGVFDDNGTIADQTDDRSVLVLEFSDSIGQTYMLDRISSFYQLPSGVLLVGTQSGLFRIDQPEELLNGNTLCLPVEIDLAEEGRYNIFETDNIRSITSDTDGQVWIGTQSTGLYCLDANLTQVLEHFSIDNSPIPNNDILSLCWVPSTKHLFVGTAEGLVEYDPEGWSEGINELEDEGVSEDEGSMQRWKLHFSYVNPTEIAASPKRVYAAASGSLFSVDRADGELNYWNKATGLRGNSVAHIAYDVRSSQLLIAYENGQIDMMDEDGEVSTMPDLSMKAGSVDVDIHSIYVGRQNTYLAMSFGIIVVNTRRGEVSDTYYIGANASAVDVRQVIETTDSLFAFSYDKVYKAALRDNLVDYTFWQEEQLSREVQQAVVWRDTLYTLQNNTLYRREGSGWTKVLDEQIQWISANDGQLLVYTENGLFRLTEEGGLAGLSNLYRMNAALFTNGEYWVAETNYGLIQLRTDGDRYFHTEGPNSNFGYCMYAAHGQIYSATGGRWASQFVRPGRINIYNGTGWRTIDEGQIAMAVGVPAYDISSIAVDPKDAGHFFAASYGRGLYEFRDYKAVKHYTTTNSPIREAVENIDPTLYTYVDGAMMDEQGNLWILNSTALGKPLHILTPLGQWYSLSLYQNGNSLRVYTPTGIWTDRRNKQRKWFMSQRTTDHKGVYLLDDGGTPTINGDDRCIRRNSWVDQNGNIVSPDVFRSFAQDHTNRIWIGTEKGLIIIPSDVDFFTSNSCKRIIIPRNDGTNLGDYLLGNEQINCLAVDGGDRMWIGTATSGLYLIEDDTITVAHFTSDNSLLPSNTIQSIAINPTTGEVFVGTDKGIASYRSDASEAQEDMSCAYAYPNPVPPHYSGVISITGLMDNTVVNIVDAGGNLVCKTRSHGGTAVWDGKDAYGNRATPGIYTALCNAEDGHTVVKILIAR